MTLMKNGQEGSLGRLRFSLTRERKERNSFWMTSVNGVGSWFWCSMLMPAPLGYSGLNTHWDSKVLPFLKNCSIKWKKKLEVNMYIIKCKAHVYHLTSPLWQQSGLIVVSLILLIFLQNLWPSVSSGSSWYILVHPWRDSWALESSW